MSRPIRTLLLAAALALALPATAPRASIFTFQGHLAQSGTPLDGNANLSFKIYDDLTAGNQLGQTFNASNFPVVDGVFAIDLLFNNVEFGEAGRWLQVEVEGTPLMPRIEIVPAPVAFNTLALQNRSVSAAVPGVGQVLKWNGAQWTPQADAGGASYSAGNGLSLTGSTFSVNFAGSGAANTASRSDHGHFGDQWIASDNQSGLYIANGSNSNRASAFMGVYSGNNDTGAGVMGLSDAANGGGVVGEGTVGVRGRGVAASGNTVGVWGTSASTSGFGVIGNATASSGDTYGVRGESGSTNGIGVYGLAYAASGYGIGVQGNSNSPTGTAVVGLATAENGINQGVLGRSVSPQGSGVRGENPALSGSTAYGVWGEAASNQARAVFGDATAAGGPSFGVYGRAASTTGTGVRGESSAATGNTVGVRGSAASTTGTGVLGDALATSGSNIGVLARTASGEGAGLRAENSATSGAGNGHALEVIGNLPSGDTMSVQANGTGSAWAIRATSAGSQVINAELTSTTTPGSTISAIANTATGRAGYFQNAVGQAAQFVGNVDVSGTLSKGGGSFKIDHPLDPANQFLLHSFVESPDMMNVYNGNIVTDARGYATIDLPDWFEALNRDFRYQLTVIGSFARAMVAEEVQGNRFAIRTETPNTKVSWQVTGIRKDRWAEKNRIPVEVQKAPAERGKYLHPELYGAPAGKRLGVESAKDAPRLAPTKSAAAPGKLP
ncbi:MAG: hypothetical protein IT478_01365 [Xanthomonadales bacterium]|nr:hypothetical protein [Xanthomonadales bacterium]